MAVAVAAAAADVYQLEAKESSSFESESSGTSSEPRSVGGSSTSLDTAASEGGALQRQESSDELVEVKASQVERLGRLTTGGQVWKAQVKLAAGLKEVRRAGGPVTLRVTCCTLPRALPTVRP